METLYRIQPTEIEQLMKEKLADRKIDDDLGWTGEWRMSVKNVLDLIIDLQNNLNSQTKIEKLKADKAELLEALETVHELVTNFTADSLMLIEDVTEKTIQKMKP